MKQARAWWLFANLLVSGSTETDSISFLLAFGAKMCMQTQM